jgi:Gas vesicle synthesis protein GvpL/GvpF
VLYVYAFVATPASVPEVRGIDSAAVETETAAGLEVVVSRHESTALEASEAAIVAHARVVEAVAAANEAVLPARFGGAHADTEALRAAVEERASELTAALARVRGCVELGVRALAPAGQRVAARSGAAYMHARLEQRQEAGRLADELHAPLAALAREATQTVSATERLLLSGAYLVPEDAVAAFREVVESLQADHPDLGIVCTGPWPPYSFATAEGGSP